MDSLCHHQSNSSPLFSRRWYSDIRRRGSTSQMCLHKILGIITTVPPPLAATVPSFPNESSAEDYGRCGFGFDLNVGVCVPPEPKESFDAGMSSSSSIALEGGGAAAGGYVGGCFDVNREDSGDRVENDGNGGSDNLCIEIGEEARSLRLLIEAAELIFGEFIADDKSECGEQDVSEVKRDEVAEDIQPIEGTAAEMVEQFEGTTSSPVVRSKRGRTQVLPGKYRDSVLEPLTRFSRTRSSILPPKRRRR